MPFKRTPCERLPFALLKVHAKTEIVAFGVPVPVPVADSARALAFYATSSALPSPPTSP